MPTSIKIEIEEEDEEMTDPPSLIDDDLMSVPNPYQYIQDLQKSTTTPNSTFKIKGYVSSTVPPMSYNTGKYSLKVKVEDGTGILVAELSDELIASMIGIPCSSFAANLNSPEGKARNKELLKQMETKLTALEGVLTVHYSSQHSIPTITHINSPTIQEAHDLYYHMVS